MSMLQFTWRHYYYCLLKRHFVLRICFVWIFYHINCEVNFNQNINFRICENVKCFMCIPVSLSGNFTRQWNMIRRDLQLPRSAIGCKLRDASPWLAAVWRHWFQLFLLDATGWWCHRVFVDIFIQACWSFSSLNLWFNFNEIQYLFI